MSPLVTTAHFPIVDLRLAAPLPPVETERLMASYQAVASRGRRLALRVDMRGFDSSKAQAHQRKESALIYRRASAELRSSIVCEARLVSNTVARCLVTAFTWMSGTPWPCAIFTSPAEAEAWIREQLVKDAAHVSRASA